MYFYSYVLQLLLISVFMMFVVAFIVLKRNLTCLVVHMYNFTFFHVIVITVPCPFIIILPVDLNYSDRL